MRSVADSDIKKGVGCGLGAGDVVDRVGTALDKLEVAYSILKSYC